MGSQHWDSSRNNMVKMERKKYKSVLALHLICISFALLSWPITGYLFINLTFISCLLWSLVQPESAEPIIVGLLVNLVCIVFEIVAISLFWPSPATNLIRFSSAMAIINLLGRVVSGLVMVLELRKIAGSTENPNKIEQ